MRARAGDARDDDEKHAQGDKHAAVLLAANASSTNCRAPQATQWCAKTVCEGSYSTLGSSAVSSVHVRQR